VRRTVNDAQTARLNSVRDGLGLTCRPANGRRIRFGSAIDRRWAAAALLAAAFGSAGCTQAMTSPPRTTEAAVARLKLGRVDWTGTAYDTSGLATDVDPGTLLAMEEQAPVQSLGGARRFRYLYQSENVAGEYLPVSAVMLVPDGPTPAGGWPVVSWAHGTTGVADRCAPSATDNLFYNEYAEEARSMLGAGYAVVATDYIGLGTPGMHSYLVGEDGANAVIDAVRAAHRVAEEDGAVELADGWFASGHSQGGQAAIFASRAAERAAPLRLLGVVAMAPASQMRLALPFIVESGSAAAVPYGVYMMAGLETVDASIHVTDLLGPVGRRSEDTFLRSGCWPQGLESLQAAQKQGEDLTQVFAITTAEMEMLTGRLSEFGDPDSEPTVGPVLVVQGETDTEVPLVATDQMVDRLTELGASLEYRTYPDKGHDQVVGPSICDRLRWMAEQGGSAVDECTAYETDLSF
jgi:dienelactone hydrolase